MEKVKIYVTNLNEEDTKSFGMTQNQLFFLEILCKKLKLIKEFKELIIPNGYESAYSRFTKPNAGLMIDALKSGNSVEIIKNAEIEKQYWNKFGGTVDSTDCVHNQTITFESEVESKLVNPDDILTQAQIEINKLLNEMAKKQKVITK